MTRTRQFGFTPRLICLVCLFALYLPSTVDAAWLGYKNDLGVAVVIQSSTVVNGQVRRGKPHTLFPGEVAWDAIPSAGVRTVSVYDPKRNNQVVLQDAINIGNTDVVLSLQMVAPAPVKGQPVQPQQPRFVPVRVQLTPPVGGAPGSPTAPSSPMVPSQPRTTPIPPRPTSPPPTPPGLMPTPNPPPKSGPG